MRVELVDTRREPRVEINLGGGMIHSVTVEEALQVANWIYELCRPVTMPFIEPGCLCPSDGHSELCPIHKVNSSPR